MVGNPTDRMLQCPRRPRYPSLLVADFHSSNDGPGLVLAQRGVIGAEPFAHQFGKTLDKLGRDSALGVGELSFEHDDIGLHMHELFGQLAVLFRETRVRGCEMTFGDKIEQAIEAGLKMRLPGLELPQLLPPCLDRLRPKIEPIREEIAKPFGNEEALFDRINDYVVELRPSNAAALADADAGSCSPNPPRGRRRAR